MAPLTGWPRFDSAACFAALLGNADNGRWQIAPAAVERKADVRIERNTDATR
jgi:hypothetical protein